uniref:Uncharacterized protein n=1 Tax=Tanacetum cinerariifolium TaxID=118510 RepID=A0A6L2M465_TANCI|nr:hypothetical protein [Tanacetum cinerariifolium]
MVDLAFAPQHNMVSYLEKPEEPLNDVYVTPTLTKKIFSNMIRKSEKSSGTVTSLFASMLAQLEVVEGVGLGNHPESQPSPSPAQPISESQIPESSSSPQNTQSPRQTLEGTGFPHTMGPNFPDPSVDLEAVHKEGVTVCDPPLSTGNTVGSREDGMEHAFELTDHVSQIPHDSPLSGGHTPGSDKGSMTLKELMDLCTTLSHKVLDLEKVKTAQSKEIRHSLDRRKVSKQERKNLKSQQKFQDIDDLVDEEVIVEDKGSGEKGGRTAETVSTARPEVSTAAPKTPPTTTTLFDDKGVTIADTLETKKRDQYQIERDAEVALKIQADLDEQVRTERERQEESSKAALAKLYEEVQSQIDADHELATRLTYEEQEKYTVKERSKLLAEFFESRKKQLAKERAKAIKINPPIKTQLRSLMMTYLKHTCSEEDEKRVGSRNKRAACLSLKQKSPMKKKVNDHEFVDNDKELRKWLKELGTIEAGGVHVYKLTRLDGSYRHFSTSSRMLEVLDRQDVLDLHKIIMKRFPANDLEERFNTIAGNLVKEILHKLSLPDHMSILTDSKVTPTNHRRMTNLYSSPRFVANYFIADSHKVLKLKNIKKDGYTRFQHQEQYVHVGPEVIRSQDGKSLIFTTQQSSNQKLTPFTIVEWIVQFIAVFACLRDVVIASIKFGLWDRISFVLEEINKEGPANTNSTKCVVDVKTDVEPVEHDVLVASKHVSKGCAGITLEDVLTFTKEYFLFSNQDCLTRTNKVVKPSVKVCMSQSYLLEILSEAANSLGEHETLSNLMLSQFLKTQFPSASLTLLEDDFTADLLTNLSKNGDHVSLSIMLFSSNLSDFRAEKGFSDTHVGTNDAIELLLKAPMFVDLSLWSCWDYKFAPSLGPLVGWLLSNVTTKELLCLVTKDGKVLRLDHSAIEFQRFEAELLVSAFCLVIKDAQLVILSECKSKEDHMLIRELRFSLENEIIPSLETNVPSKDGNKDSVTTLIVHNEKSIIVLNNEQGFSAENIKALYDVGKKKASSGYIGKKGIGFKLVFRVTDAPEIHFNRFHIDSVYVPMGQNENFATKEMISESIHPK